MKVVTQRHNVYNEIGFNITRNAERKWIVTFDYWFGWVELWL